ncbi:MAG TPA: hypothetical protein VMW16_06720 [Sedimentisphaerales bacterium]|nr:hypothetical protein [Sedimentisphaerales bacterium]
MRTQYIYQIIRDFTQSEKGDYHSIRYSFPESNGFEVLVKISNPMKRAWEKSCADIDWAKCLCYVAITEGLKKQKAEIFLKEAESPQHCPWPNIRNNFADNICFIESPDPPFGFHSKKNESSL